MANKHGQATDSFLEGPSFDREGNLYVTDIPYGRIFRVSRDGDWSLIIAQSGTRLTRLNRSGTLVHISQWRSVGGG